MALPQQGGPAAVDALRKDVEDIVKGQHQFAREARALLIQQKFTQLDAKAAELRSANAHFDDGYSKLVYFYEMLATDWNEHPKKQQLADLKAWQRAKPKSVAAWVATAHACIHYAWKARGQGSRDSVSADRWKVFEDLLSQADAALKSAGPAAAKDPGFQIARVRVAGPSCRGIQAIWQSKELELAPDIEVFRAIGNFLLPRWCGDAEEYHAFAERAAELAKKDSGDMVYALLAWDAWYADKDTGFAAYGFDWARVVRGFRDAFRKYPKAVINYHRLARMTYARRDIATAKELFALPELAWLPGVDSVWEPPDMHDKTRRWALRIR